MNTKQKLQDLILKYKDQKQNDLLVNELCRLYFEVENYESEDPKPQIKLSDFIVEKDDLITESILIYLCFNKETSIIFEKKATEYLTVIYNTHNKELSIYDEKISDTIVLDKLFTKKSELVNLLNSII